MIRPCFVDAVTKPSKQQTRLLRWASTVLSTDGKMTSHEAHPLQHGSNLVACATKFLLGTSGTCPSVPLSSIMALLLSLSLSPSLLINVVFVYFTISYDLLARVVFFLQKQFIFIQQISKRVGVRIIVGISIKFNRYRKCHKKIGSLWKKKNLNQDHKCHSNSLTIAKGRAEALN